MISYQTTLFSLLLLQCLLLGAFLIRQGRLAVLRTFLFILAFHMVLNLVEGWLGRDITSYVAPVLAQLYGPLLFLFFMELMYADFRFESRHAVHLLPAGLVAVLLTFYGPNNVIPFFIYTTFFLYLTFAFIKILQVRREIRETYSDPWGTKLGWVAIILSGFLLAGSLDSLSRFAASPGSFAALALQTLSMVILLVTLTSMVWKAMNHPRVLVSTDTSSFKRSDASDEIDNLALERFKQDIENLFTEKSLHLKPRLSVAEVADQLRVTPREVSSLVRSGFDLNFSDYVNSKRVDEAVSLMQNPKHRERSLLQIAFDAGFNSKTAFHDSFKKKMKTTPSAWRRAKTAASQNTG